MENTEQPVSTQTRNGKSKSWLLWVLGFILVFAGIGTFTTSIFGGVLMLIAGAILLPPTHSLIQEKLHVKLSGGLRAVIVIILFSIAANTEMGNVKIDKEVSSTTTVDSPTTKPVEENIETIVEKDGRISTPVVQKNETPVAPVSVPAKTETKTESIAIAQTVPVTQNDRSSVLAVLKANASKEWGDDYQMVKFEYDNQVQAYDWVMAHTKYPDIMTKAKQEWGDDYQMVKFEYGNQVTAFEWVSAQTAHLDIMAKAKQEWGTDYQMVKFEYDNQVKAYNDL